KVVSTDYGDCIDRGNEQRVTFCSALSALCSRRFALTSYPLPLSRFWRQKLRDYCRSLIPLFFFSRQLPAACACELVELGLAVVFRDTPFRNDPAFLLQLQQ